MAEMACMVMNRMQVDAKITMLPCVGQAVAGALESHAVDQQFIANGA